MQKQLFVAILLLGVVVAGFTACSNPPANNANTAAVATPEPTPDRAAIGTELTRIENDWPRIIKERDGATVRRIEADDVVIVYPDGQLGNREQDAKDIEDGLFTFDSWDTLEVKVNVVDKNLALVTLRYAVKNGKVKSRDGRSMDVSGQYLSLDTFARRNDQWQFIGLSSVKVQSPVSAASPTPSTAASPATARPSATPRSSPVPRATPAERPSVARPTPAARPSAPRPTPARSTPAATP
jgi:ketosteroid isomerase-like protein